jgi:2-methylisocitrate lyase-like PEP mutase family enzyme
MPTVEEKRRAFRALHAAGCFVLPNPWDLGTARWLQRLGFQALATTSAGLAFSRGLPDAALGRDEVLAHLRELAAGTDVPINADYQAGYGATPDEVAASVRLAVDTGIAGLSIEDASGDAAAPLFPLDAAVARIAAARRAIDASGTGVLLTGRSEGFICGRPDLDETVRRLRAYAAAGADVLYAPGLTSIADIRQVVDSVDRPVNVLALPDAPPVAELAEAGVARISIGGGFAYVAMGAVVRAANELRDQGTYGFWETAGVGAKAWRDANC